MFDCAFKPHHGTRSLHYRGHLQMMAAAQPFISGAISKTVNMPEERHRRGHHAHLHRGLEARPQGVAIYRDGSKRSAPLNTKKTVGMGGAGRCRHARRRGCSPNASPRSIRENEELRKKSETRARRHMPDTRTSLTHKFEIAGHEGYITVGLYPDGQPGELFVTMAKEGSTIGGLMDTVGTLTSIALQYGVPLEELVNKFAHQRFEPSGFTKNPDIRTAFSITDYVFRWLGCEFINGYREATSPEQPPGRTPDARNRPDGTTGRQPPGPRTQPHRR